MSKYYANIKVPVIYQIRIDADDEDEAWDIAEKEGYDRIDFAKDAIDDDENDTEVIDVSLADD